MIIIVVLFIKTVPGKFHSPGFVRHVFRLQREQKSTRNIAQTLGKRRNAICNILQKCDSETGKLLNPGNRGKPSCTADKNALVVGYFQANRFDITLRQAAVDLGLHLMTTWKRLHEAKGRHVNAVQKDLTQAPQDKRENLVSRKERIFARGSTFFDQVLYSEESMFRLIGRRRKVLPKTVKKS